MADINEKPQISKKEDASSVSHNESLAQSPDRGSFENVNAKLANPLAGLSHEQLMEDAKVFAETHGMSELTLEFQKGALIAQDPTAFESLPLLDEDDRNVLRRELTHKWDQPKMLYYLVVLCSMAAAVQGVSARLFGNWSYR